MSPHPFERRIEFLLSNIFTWEAEVGIFTFCADVAKAAWVNCPLSFQTEASGEYPLVETVDNADASIPPWHPDNEEAILLRSLRWLEYLALTSKTSHTWCMCLAAICKVDARTCAA